MTTATIACLRVSTGAQDLDQQRLAIFDYAQEAETHGGRVRRNQVLFTACRPEARADGEGRGVATGDRLIVSELSRLGRSLGEILHVIDRLIHKGVHLLSIKESIRFEGKQNLQTKEGLAGARARGKRLGRPKGARGRSKLDGKEDDVRTFLTKGVFERLHRPNHGVLSHYLRKAAIDPDVLVLPWSFPQAHLV